jgi:ADP-ribose pyrophosphatase
MQKVIYQGRKIKVAIDESVNKDGLLIKRDIILHPGAVVILPIVDDEHVCLLKNYRFVIGETLWEIPAGTLEPNEPIEVAAERELQEETGYRATKWTYRGYFYASPGVLDEKLHLFFAEGLTKGFATPEADEQLEPVIVPIKNAIEMILNGSIKDAKTVSALLLWDYYRKA